jgi:hypothetical protein
VPKLEWGYRSMAKPISEDTSKKNQEGLLRRVISTVGQKYTPDLHIPLPILNQLLRWA